ncbi:hypothetical protein [Ruania albidiflava]|uniref:hypothetical protein n=1 Tax=Ruania albidiflava TaxID=366586 RepID=UPI0003B2E3F1|nr:hypothetical protein [Ruania albidiflava]
MDPLPQHWTTAEDHVQGPDGRRYALRVWGWSARSMAEAADVARDRVAELVERVRQGGPLRRDSYYPRLPLREEVLTEIRDADGALVAAITRNRYGALVLNTDRLLIADVDSPEGERAARRAVRKVRADRERGGSLGRLVGRLLGRSGPAEHMFDPPATSTSGAVPEDGSDEEPTPPELTRIDTFAQAHPELGVHVYRTAAGYRVLITGADAAPDSEQAAAIMRELASDPVYVTLCATHRTYRARLTPKPWRVGLPALTARWPWQDARTADRAFRWQARYTEACAGSAVCQKVRDARREPRPEEGLVLDAHDRAVLGAPGAPLA